MCSQINFMFKYNLWSLKLKIHAETLMTETWNSWVFIGKSSRSHKSVTENSKIKTVEKRNKMYRWYFCMDEGKKYFLNGRKV